MTAGRAAPLAITLRRTIPARRGEVFRAWTDPAELKRWWARPGFTVVDAQVDLRIGGGFRIDTRPDVGNVFSVFGSYREVRPPERLVYTWAWQGTRMDGIETLVTVDFREAGQDTEVLLTHEGFDTQGDHTAHRDAWIGCFDRLSQAISSRR